MSLLQRFDGLFKEWYHPRVYETLNNKNPFFALLEKRTKENWSGRELKFAIHNRRNEGTGFRGINDTVPAAGNQNHDQAALVDTLFYGSIELHDREITATKTNTEKAAFKAVLDSEMKGLVTDVRDHFSRNAYMLPPEIGSKLNQSGGAKNQYDTSIGVAQKTFGNGVGSLNNVLCVAFGAPSGSTIKVGMPGGYFQPSGQDIGGCRYLRVGMRLAYGNLSTLASGSQTGVLQITAVNYKAQTFTYNVLNGSAPAANMAFVKGHMSPDGTAPSGHEYDKGLAGLGLLYAFKNDENGAGLYSTGSKNYLKQFEDLTTSDEGDESWRPFFATSGGVWNEMEILDLIANMDEWGSGEADLMVSHSSVQREFVATLSKQVEYEPQMFKAGVRQIEFAADRPMRWVADRFCPYGVIYVLDDEDIFWAVNRDFGWDDKGGSVLKSLLVGATGGVDKVRGVYKWFGQLAWTGLNTHGVIDGINVSSTPK